MNSRPRRYRLYFNVLAAMSLVVVVAMGVWSSTSARRPVAFYPGCRFLMDTDFWIVERCGSGYQNVLQLSPIIFLYAPIIVIACWLIERLHVLDLKLRPYGQRAKIGTCQVCGYDLRATPLRCPESGTVPRSAGSGGGTA